MCKNLSIAVAAMALLFSSGCETKKGLDDLERFVDEAFADERPEIEPIPRIRPQETFVYAASDMADPFAITNLRRKTATTDNARPDESRRREPLERYPLDALYMVGTLFGDNDRWVIVRAPGDSIHSAKVGNYIGQHSGLITKITENAVEITEKIPAPAGGWQDHMVNMSLVQ